MYSTYCIEPGLTARLFKDLSQALCSWSDSYRNRELLQPVCLQLPTPPDRLSYFAAG